MLVTDFSDSIMRIDAGRYTLITKEAREMLRVYSESAWVEGNDLCFRVASYRVSEIERACGETT